MCHTLFAGKVRLKKCGSGHWSFYKMENILEIEVKCLTKKLYHALFASKESLGKCDSGLLVIFDDTKQL